MPRRNRVDPWGDLHAVPHRGTFTGNRGCLIDDSCNLARHHRGVLWTTCRTEYRDWQHPLDQPRTWTPLFFLDDAVALAAGHRPCGLCRRTDYLAYRNGVMVAMGSESPVVASDLNRRLAGERLHRGRGLTRARDRITWEHQFDRLPTGTVILDRETGAPQLVADHYLQPFGFEGWGLPIDRPRRTNAQVLTPPTSVAALGNGFVPVLHHSAL